MNLRSGLARISRRAWFAITDSPSIQEIVGPSWKSEFIQGYGCGLFGGVEP